MDLMIFLMMMVRHRLFAVLGNGTAEQLRYSCKSNHTTLKGLRRLLLRLIISGMQARVLSSTPMKLIELPPDAMGIAFYIIRGLVFLAAIGLRPMRCDDETLKFSRLSTYRPRASSSFSWKTGMDWIVFALYFTIVGQFM